MKNTKTLVSKALKKVVEKTLVVDANRTSCSIVYQPKAPMKIEKYKNKKYDF